MEIKHFENFSKAMFYAMYGGKKYIVVKHELKKEEETKRHYHPIANEWIIVNDGSFIVSLEGATNEFKLVNEPTIIHFPSGLKHSLIALTDLGYLTIRTEDDETIFE